MILTAGHAIYHMNFLQAIAIGLLQGISELFPVSSLGHTVLVPSWIGGTWATLVRQESQAESPYLAFVVGLHLATAVVLVVFYFREWARLVAGFLRSVGRRKVVTDEERLAWLIVIATVPVGALGLALEHQFRVLFAKPLAAALFLMANGAILSAGELHRRRQSATPGATDRPPAAPPFAAASAGLAPGAGRRDWRRDARPVTLDAAVEHKLSRIGVPSAAIIGASQALALLAGISREGVAMVGGLFRGLDNENALRFSFLLSTPVIFAAGRLRYRTFSAPSATASGPR